MCCTAWGKWWSYQILTDFRTLPKKKKKYFRMAFYCAQSKGNTHAVWSAWYGTPVSWDGSCQQRRSTLFTSTDLDRFVNDIWQKWLFLAECLPWNPGQVKEPMPPCLRLTIKGFNMGVKLPKVPHITALPGYGSSMNNKFYTHRCVTTNRALTFWT